MKTWFTSDLHLGHANVIDYCKRPFRNVDEMNAAIIKNWNAVVGDRDEVFVLGDVALCRPERSLAFVAGLKGRKYLVFGNHDKPNRKHYERSGLFEWCKDLAEVKVGPEPQRIVLCHYPMLTWNKSHHGTWMLHGHCHGSLPVDRTARRADVGVDNVLGYRPIAFEELVPIMENKAFKPIDHHGAD